MATLVLTTVGGAIGGPVGAALGAVLGQRVDRALLAPKGRAGPRLSELKVQTSSYGTQVPKIFGRMRVAGCVIWATDLIEQRGTTSGGKGQGSVTRYSYAASFAVALSARRIAGVGRIWADGKLLRGAAGDWKAKTDFRLYPGDEEQLPDPLIASAVGGGVAPAHRGTAYAVFELLQLADFGNRIPSLTFEVIQDDGVVRVGDVARAIGEGALVGDGPDTPIHGFAASGDTIAGAVEVLARLSGGWFSCRGGDGGGGVALANRVADPISMDARVLARTRVPVERTPARVEVSHYDPARDYQIGVQRAVRGGGGGVEQVPLAAALSADAAKGLALSTLLTRERMRETRQIVSDARAIAVKPGDAVRVGDDPAVWRVVRSSVEAMRVTLDLAPLGRAPDGRAAEAGVVNASPDVAIGRTVIAVFELYPSGEEAWSTPRLGIAAAGDRPGWRQATIEISRDDSATWQMLGATAAPAIMGTVAAPVGRASATMIDRANVIDVDLLHDGMALSHADDAQRDRGANLALLGDEVIQFTRAEQVAPARWRLSLLSRGLNGSAVDVHDAGTRFVLLGRDSLLVASEGVVRLGDRVRVSASGIGDDVGDGDAARAGHATFLDGRSVAPLAPVHLRWNPAADGGARVTWVRRSRLGWRWGEVEAPIGEESERYRVAVSSMLGERVEMLAEPAITITAAEVAGGSVRVAVVQVGTVASSRAAVIEQGSQS
ncbi:phage tail protein [uncultured Sphingomonas sp.]|uniref:GTA baseplate fiber-binding domain-containing protein n=1 Tax=uncultured Sphingomonas sp. TaxID=158754 RepID=UPI0025D1A5F4|nr:phage tail protein [uncultured Sphingomonas sp.]